MILYIKQKIFSFTDAYNVVDDNQQPVYQVQSEFLTLGAKIHIYDLFKNELFFIKQKLMVFLPEYEIYKGETLCAIVKKELSLFKPKLDIDSEYGHFKIEGNVFSMDFEISSDGKSLGTIRKEWMAWGDVYELNISSEKDAAFFCAMVIAIDNCLHNGQNN